MMTPDHSLVRLLEGNSRFSSGVASVVSFVGSLSLDRLASEGQKPFAIVLTCSDSRAPTESLFDCSLGDLFVLRIAGNVLAPQFLAGIEYACQFLSIPFCLVLGHTRCGAVAAASEHLKNPNQILPTPSLQELIQLVASHQKSQTNDPDQLCLDNVRQTVQSISDQSTLISRKVQENQFRIVGAVYNIETGKVKFDLSKEELKRVKILYKSKKPKKVA